MPLGRKEDLDPSDIVLDGDPAPPSKRGRAPSNFRAMSIVAKRLDGLTWYGGSLGPGRIVLHGDPAPPPKRGTAPNVYCGQTVAHLSYC